MDDVKSTVLYILEKDLDIMITSLDQKLELRCSQKVRLIMGLEDDLQIITLDEDIEGLDTPAKIMEYVERRAKDERNNL